jgi:hypothetical protein
MNGFDEDDLFGKLCCTNEDESQKIYGTAFIIK